MAGKRAELEVKNLFLDQQNYRALPHNSQEKALAALVEIDRKSFWALFDSLADDGYDETESIIVQQIKNKLVVKEGNRRVAALKLILGLLSYEEIPDEQAEKIASASKAFKKNLSKVPCILFEEEQRKEVVQIVSRIHGKRALAGRSSWPSVAKARFERDEQGKANPSLDLYEAYLEQGKNLKGFEIASWEGDYPISVLDEALGRLVKHFNLGTKQELVNLYPKKHRQLLERLMYDIGTIQMRFPEIRQSLDKWPSEYGLKIDSSSDSERSDKGSESDTGGSPKKAGKSSKTSEKSATPTPIKRGSLAQNPNDPRFLSSFVKKLKVAGTGKEKARLLLDELALLNIEKTPHAFCITLRSIVEILVSFHCKKHKICMVDEKGNDLPLAKKLEEVVEKLKTVFFPGQEKSRDANNRWSSALKEVKTVHNVLSIKSMNYVVHNPNYIVDPAALRIAFFNLTVLLTDMCEHH